VSSPSEKVKPSGVSYLIPLLVFLVGAVVGVALIVGGAKSYNDTINGFGRVPLNGQGVVSFSKTGNFTAYLEQPGIDDTVFTPPVSLQMTKVDSGKPVVFRDYSGSGEYSNGGHDGAAINTFEIEEEGDYTLVTSGSGTGEVAVGRSPFGRLKTGIISGILAGGGGFVLAIILAILLAVRRGRSKRQLRAAHFGDGGYGAPGYGAPGYGAQPQWQPQPQPYGQPPPYGGGWP